MGLARDHLKERLAITRFLLSNLEHPCTRHLISKTSEYDGS